MTKNIHNDICRRRNCLLCLDLTIILKGKSMFTKKFNLFAFLVLSFGLTNLNLIAQDEASDDVEEVVVTGTRLKANGFEAVSPVAVVTADNIKKTGLVRMEDVLNQMPQIDIKLLH